MALPTPPPGLNVDASLVPIDAPAEAILRTLAFGAVALRIYARWKGSIPFWWDDWFVFVEAFILVPVTICKFFTYSIGLGRHIWWVTDHEDVATRELLGKLAYFNSLHFVPAIALLKLSILAFFVRIFWVNKHFVRLCYVQMALAVVWLFVSEFFFAFRCSPASLAWSSAPPPGSCIPEEHIYIPVTAANAITDYLIFFTPLYVIWTLQLPNKKKLLISLILMLGAAECIFSTVRLVLISRLSFQDTTWDASIRSLLCSLDCDVGTILVCIPTYGTLLPRAWRDQSETSTAFSSAKATRQSDLSRLSRSAVPKVGPDYDVREKDSLRSLSGSMVLVHTGNPREVHTESQGIVRETEVVVDYREHILPV